MNPRRAALAALILLAAPALHAGPLGDGVTVLTGTITNLTMSMGTILGPVLVLFGGARTAWKAVHGEPFTRPLLEAIVGVAIVAAVV